MRFWLLALAVLVAAFLALSARLFAFPTERVPARADAVVVLAGQWERRLPIGRRLVREGVAPVLALSEDTDRDWPDQLCRRGNVVCFQADPYSTTGEAAALAVVAERRQWRRVILVTSDYHVTRATLLVDRCLDARVDAVAADEPFAAWLYGAAWEWPKLVHALAVKRGC